MGYVYLSIFTVSIFTVSIKLRKFTNLFIFKGQKSIILTKTTHFYENIYAIQSNTKQTKKVSEKTDTVLSFFQISLSPGLREDN